MKEMQKQEILIDETGHIDNVLLEEKHIRPGCLGQLRGPICDWKEPTRNNHYYTRSHWKRVFNLPWVKEAMENNVLFGEADHPKDRVEPSLKEAAVVLVDYQERPEEMDYVGTFDILDTPSGQILRTLAEYGCKLGVSSRGKGNLRKVGGRNTVDENSYIFGGFDVVAIPAVAKARQEFLKESQEMTGMKEQILTQVDECASVPELNIIRGMLHENAHFTDIVEHIDDRIQQMSNQNESSEETVSPQKETPKNDTIVEGLTSDLRTAYGKIAEQGKRIAELEEEIQANTIDKEESIDNIRQLNDLIRENQSYAEVVENMRQELESKTGEINRLREKPQVMSGQSRSIIIGLQERVESMKEAVQMKDEKLKELKESLQKASSGLKDAQEKLSRKTQEAKDLHEELKETQTELLETTDALEAKQDELKQVAGDLSHASKNAKDIAAELSDRDRDLDEAKRDVALLQEKLEMAEQESTQLEEMLHSANSDMEGATDNLNSANEEIQRLQELVQEKDSFIEKLKSKSDEMKESLQEAENALAKAEQENEKLREQSESNDEEYDSLVDDYNFVCKENEMLRKFYLQQKAMKSGYSAEALEKLLPEGYTIEDIDSLISSRSKLRRKVGSLPISIPRLSPNERVISTRNLGESHENSELSNARSMLKSMNR